MALRSFLFVPGDSRRKMERAIASKAGVVIIDLEDSVAPSEKVTARQQACEMLLASDSRLIAVRVNAQDTDWYRDDLLSVVPVKPDFIMLPKCRSVQDIIRLDQELALLERQLQMKEGHVKLLPLVTEDALSVSALDYRSAPSRTAALCFAAEDLASNLGISPRDQKGQLVPPLLHARVATQLAARAANLQAIDTPFPDPHRNDLLHAEADMAVNSGFSGKLCIHPDQIDVVEKLFIPSPEKLRWADEVIAAFADNPGSGVTVVGGRMVDKAHLRLAEELRANT